MSEAPVSVPAEAMQALDRFLAASLRRDEEAMKACVTRKTLESGKMHTQGPEGVRFIKGDARMEGDNAVIPIKAIRNDAPDNEEAVMEMDCVMAREDGEWKFDLLTTMDRLMGGSLDEVVDAMTSQMAEAMKGVGEALAGGMQEAFGQISSALSSDGQISSATSEGGQNWEDASLEIGEDEFFAMPEMTPLPKTQAAVSAAAGSEILVLAAIEDLMRQLGSEDRDGLINWFDDQLFAGLGDVIARVAAEMPLKNRLRAIRVEAAGWSDDRCIALDGNDVVYRMYLNNTDGYYSDAELARILSCALPGLPAAIDARAAGRRMLANDSECPPIELYRERVAPRFMQRISEMMGRNIRFEANWDDLSETSTMTRQLSRWGLNRIYGGIALALQEESLREAVLSGLKAIRIAFGYNMGDRFACYEDGTLEVGLSWYHGEKGCLYEADIAGALAGNPIKYEEPAAEAAETTEDAEAPKSKTGGKRGKRKKNR